MRRFLAPSLFALLLASLVARLPAAVLDRSAALERLDPLLESRRILMDEFLRPVDDEAASVAAAEAYVAALGDPFTQYIPPAGEEAFTRSMRGAYAGIGAEVNFADGRFTIVSPMAGSPALRAGLRAGDEIVAVDGEPIDGLDGNAIVERLLGEPGTEVRVTVVRDGVELGERTIVRRGIVQPTVRGLVRAGEGWHWCLDADAGIRYVRVTQFNAETAADLARALEPAAGEPMAGLVLDLRDNPGGGLPTAIEVSDLLMDAGVIVRVAPRTGSGRTYAASPGGTRLTDLPIAVLVNEQSASASEIVAGALQEAGRAVVVGMRTFGKGSVQQVRSLDTAGGTLKYTVAAWELGSGRRLQRFPDSETWGVDPDPGYEVPVSIREYTDLRLRRQVFEGIRQSDEEYGDPPFDAATACRSIDWVREELGDRQLAVAAEALAERIRTGAWPQREPPDRAVLVRRAELMQLEALRQDLDARLVEVDQRLEVLRAAAEAADAGEAAAGAAGADPETAGRD